MKRTLIVCTWPKMLVKKKFFLRDSYSKKVFEQLKRSTVPWIEPPWRMGSTTIFIGELEERKKQKKSKKNKKTRKKRFKAQI